MLTDFGKMVKKLMVDEDISQGQSFTTGIAGGLRKPP
jgi:hypothetical protein